MSMITSFDDLFPMLDKHNASMVDEMLKTFPKLVKKERL